MLAFEQEGFAPFQARFAARDALAGRAVRLSDGTEGSACGVGPHGALRLQTAAGMRDISSQEVSVRPLTAAQPHSWRWRQLGRALPNRDRTDRATSSTPQTPTATRQDARAA